MQNNPNCDILHRTASTVRSWRDLLSVVMRRVPIRLSTSRHTPHLIRYCRAARAARARVRRYHERDCYIYWSRNHVLNYAPYYAVYASRCGQDAYAVARGLRTIPQFIPLRRSYLHGREHLEFLDWYDPQIGTATSSDKRRYLC